MEHECGELPATPNEEWGGAGSSRVIRVAQDEPSFAKSPPKRLSTVAGNNLHCLHINTLIAHYPNDNCTTFER